ncbi:flagellar basal body P-ring formation chaperone FlgA [Craterilacuibacter sp. RT1T]|uniref:flagellar basal body P-ring formation chaperone FlgA n=1 Tax=Craterilacuibacter sp. RT1T TaxID=2942211 RepID=UPI0020BED798|nr:flagellar basal body P-ring formation chaperone FlgA [Craterilacuibacter sp. RT1T]MCL6262277.1 flagellar basal body P-ring formation chaperone FlgA [Craterilacuibacter sp. RT1T]
MAIFTNPCRQTLMLGLLCLAKGALASTPAIQQQLDIAVKQALLSQAKAGDKPPDAQLSFIPPREADRLPPCPSALQIRAIDTRNPGRMRFAVSCPELWQNIWTVRARLPAPPTPKTEAAPSKAQQGRHKEEVAEQGRKQDAEVESPPPSTPVSQGNGRVLIRRGDKVDIIARRPGIEVRVNGEAQNQGKAGDIIRVMNLASGRIFLARVNAAGSVSPLASLHAPDAGAETPPHY